MLLLWKHKHLPSKVVNLKLTKPKEHVVSVKTIPDAALQTLMVFTPQTNCSHVTEQHKELLGSGRKMIHMVA